MNMRTYFLLIFLLSLSYLSHPAGSPLREERHLTKEEQQQLKDMQYQARMQAKFETTKREYFYTERIKEQQCTPRYTYKDLVQPLSEEQQLVFDLFLNRNELEEDTDAELEGGIILAGPPGTGKSFFVESLAGELAQHGYTFYKQSAATVNVGYAGEGAAYLAVTFKYLRSEATKENPIIFFIDEIDAIAKKRELFGGGAAGSDMQNTLDHLLTELADNTNNYLTVVVATNRLSVLDSAFKRTGRMHISLHFSLPNKEKIENEVKRCTNKYQQKWKNRSHLISIKEIIEDEFTIRDVEEVFKWAAWHASLEKSDAVKERHYEKAMKFVKKEKLENKKLDFNSTSDRMGKVLARINQLKAAGYDKGIAIKMIQSWGYDGDLTKELPN
ncbi:AAA family ATPase [Candidatus Dependentiae bacterium]|nr:AAA family ATPase [Candidatus Dependentiae bacterium]